MGGLYNHFIFYSPPFDEWGVEGYHFFCTCYLCFCLLTMCKLCKLSKLCKFVSLFP